MSTADDIMHVAEKWRDPPHEARDLAVSVDGTSWVPYLDLVDPLKPWDYPHFRWRNLAGGWNTGGAILRRAMQRSAAARPAPASYKDAPPDATTGGDFVPGVNGGPPTATPIVPSGSPPGAAEAKPAMCYCGARDRTKNVGHAALCQREHVTDWATGWVCACGTTNPVSCLCPPESPDGSRPHVCSENCSHSPPKMERKP